MFERISVKSKRARMFLECITLLIQWLVRKLKSQKASILQNVSVMKSQFVIVTEWRTRIAFGRGINHAIFLIWMNTLYI